MYEKILNKFDDNENEEDEISLFSHFTASQDSSASFSSQSFIHRSDKRLHEITLLNKKMKSALSEFEKKFLKNIKFNELTEQSEIQKELIQMKVQIKQQLKD